MTTYRHRWKWFLNNFTLQIRIEHSGPNGPQRIRIQFCLTIFCDGLQSRDVKNYQRARIRDGGLLIITRGRRISLSSNKIKNNIPSRNMWKPFYPADPLPSQALIQQILYPGNLLFSRSVAQPSSYPADPLPKQPFFQQILCPAKLLSPRSFTQATLYPADPLPSQISYPADPLPNQPFIQQILCTAKLVSSRSFAQATFHPADPLPSPALIQQIR